jgi:hypothetical protein
MPQRADANQEFLAGNGMQADALSHRNRGRIRGRLEKNSTAEPVAEQKRKEKKKLSKGEHSSATEREPARSIQKQPRKGRKRPKECASETRDRRDTQTAAEQF